MDDLLTALSNLDTNGVLLLILIVLVGIILIFQFRKTANISTPLQNLNQSIQNIRVETTKLTEKFQAEAEIQKQTSESIRRLEKIMAGSGSIGAAGEYVIEEFLSTLPSEWQTRDFRVGNKTVEFGLRLPNRLILPIDSKWPATKQVEEFSTSDNPDEQRRLKTQIERIVINKAKEVQKYIDPNITTPFGIAVVPDAVYNLCPSVNVKTLEYNVIVISYSLLLPYLLIVFQIMLTTTQTIDATKAGIHLRTIEQSIKDLQSEIEGRFSNALTMLYNSKGDIQTHLGKANSALANIESMSLSASLEVEADDEKLLKNMENEEV
jgi:DNA recombination protein RmuC